MNVVPPRQCIERHHRDWIVVERLRCLFPFSGSLLAPFHPPSPLRPSHLGRSHVWLALVCRGAKSLGRSLRVTGGRSFVLILRPLEQTRIDNITWHRARNTTHNAASLHQLRNELKARTERRNWTELTRFSFWRTDQMASRASSKQGHQLTRTWA